ncbi:MAG: transglutaminase family protein [Rhodospirillales bacterium]|nr:transglutaminase family protein [Rhodospirillales bacterium]MBO6787596.1 transglutaminase family protein [Rhodospirillales bacterium]
MRTRTEIIDRLTRFGGGDQDDLDLAEATLLVGALDRPALPVDRYRRHLEKLQTKVGDYARIDDGPVPVAVMIDALRQVLSRHYGYGGGESNGTDEDCFDLTRVIDSRIGSSDALAILYATTARRLGWEAEILHIPGRMLIRLQAMGERLVADPLGDGRTLEPADIRAILKAFDGNESELTPDGLKVMTDKEALLRLLGGRKAVLLRGKRLEEAAGLLDLALRIAPEEPTLWRECGLLNARLDRIQAAVDALEEYLRLGAGESARYNTTILLQELRTRLT